MIRLKDIDVIFNKNKHNESHALKNINLEISKHECMTIVGGNGSGKSTLMNVISGNIQPDKGKIIINNLDVTMISPEKRTQMIARVFQDPINGIFVNLTIEENLSLAIKRGQMRGLTPSLDNKIRIKFREFLSNIGMGLEYRLKEQVSSLSVGEKQALSLIMATILKSDILLLDEHTTGFDPPMVSKIMRFTDRIVKQNKITTLMITHNILDVLTLCNRTIIMSNGHIVRDISAEECGTISLTNFFHYLKV